jgi:hypothetical protein
VLGKKWPAVSPPPLRLARSFSRLRPPRRDFQSLAISPSPQRIFPDSWRPTVASNGVEAVGLEGAVRLVVEFVSALDAEGAGAAVIKQLAERGIVVAPETKRTARRHFNGSDALKIDFSGAESKGEPDVTLILIAALRKPDFVAICYWGDDEALESVSNDIQANADSVEFVK